MITSNGQSWTTLMRSYGVSDATDNCPDVANPTQADQDGEGEKGLAGGRQRFLVAEQAL